MTYHKIKINQFPYVINLDLFHKVCETKDLLFKVINKFGDKYFKWQVLSTL